MSRAENPPVVQRFSDEYIERCRELSSQEIVRFLEDYRMLFGLASNKAATRRRDKMFEAAGEIRKSSTHGSRLPTN